MAAIGDENNARDREMVQGRYDPVQRAEDMAARVSRGDLRKYYRFRPARFYGGIATADCVGCCLRCLFCWSWREVVMPEKYGRFYTPADVAGKLTGIARKGGFQQVRISGNEATLSREHLMKVVERIPEDLLFILETNGILIGNDETYARDLARFENLYVRVSLKGCSEGDFARITGAVPEGFGLQLRALENLCRAGVQVHPAVMASFSPPERLKTLQKKLKGICGAFENVEIEEFLPYGGSEKRLKRANLEIYSHHRHWL